MSTSATTVAGTAARICDLTEKARFALDELSDSRDAAAIHDVASTAIEAISIEAKKLKTITGAA